MYHNTLICWQETCLLGLFSHHERASLHWICRHFSAFLFLSWLTHLWSWIMTLVGCTKAAGSFCCQRWQAESPYSGWNNGGLRWYGIVCQCYLWLSPVKICSTTNKILFLEKPPCNKEVAEMPPFTPGGPEDEHKQSPQDHRVTAVCEVRVLWGLKTKSNLKHESPMLLLWSTKRSGDLPVPDRGILRHTQPLHKAAVSVVTDSETNLAPAPLKTNTMLVLTVILHFYAV